ncbi:MAG: hypothetical protein ACK4OE_01840 [Acidovorax sp.]|uniref:hypothetical protein n=1 Tax=Acidovorax sp. TaxID=1872122 RepID=UPI00391B155C
MFTPFPGTLVRYPTSTSLHESEGWGISVLAEFLDWYVVVLKPDESRGTGKTLLVRDAGWLAALLLELDASQVVSVGWMSGSSTREVWHQRAIQGVYIETQHNGREEERLVLRTASNRLIDSCGRELNVTVDMFCSSSHVRSLYLHRRTSLEQSAMYDLPSYALS